MARLVAAPPAPAPEFDAELSIRDDPDMNEGG